MDDVLRLLVSVATALVIGIPLSVGLVWLSDLPARNRERRRREARYSMWRLKRDATEAWDDEFARLLQETAS